MALVTKAIKGTQDLLPCDSYKNRYVEQTIFRDQESHNLLCILRDVTEQEEARLKKEDLNRQTAEVADQVVNKQMRIVQQIASLLGVEPAAPRQPGPMDFMNMGWNGNSIFSCTGAVPGYALRLPVSGE